MNAAAPGSPSQRYSTLLWRLLSGGDWERAAAVARDWLAEDPESVQAHLAAGQALINLKRYAQAQPHLAKALAGNPHDGFAHRLASITSFHEKDFARADEHIQQALTLQPNDAHHWYHLAWMRYQQGALDVAAKHAARALELQPNNASTVNLLALCGRQDGRARLAQYQRALELEPENGVVHNNLGACYLEVYQDFTAAEASFRRSLMLNPSDPTAQRNLFAVLRHRDIVYRLLTLPRALVARFSWRGNKGSYATRIAALACWLCLARFLLAILVFWFALVFPLVKAYEYLTLGDLRAQAGVPGARRGGLLGYRRWPFAVRFGIFAALALLFWGAVIVISGDRLLSVEGAESVYALGILIFGGYTLARAGKWVRRWFIVRRSERKLARQLPSPTR